MKCRFTSSIAFIDRRFSFSTFRFNICNTNVRLLSRKYEYHFEIRQSENFARCIRKHRHSKLIRSMLSATWNTSSRTYIFSRWRTWRARTRLAELWTRRWKIVGTRRLRHDSCSVCNTIESMISDQRMHWKNYSVVLRNQPAEVDGKRRFLRFVGAFRTRLWRCIGCLGNPRAILFLLICFLRSDVSDSFIDTLDSCDDTFISSLPSTILFSQLTKTRIPYQRDSIITSLKWSHNYEWNDAMWYVSNESIISDEW